MQKLIILLSPPGLPVIQPGLSAFLIKTLSEIDDPQIIPDLWQDANEPSLAIAYPLQQGDMIVFADPNGKLGMVYVEGVPPGLADGSLEVKILWE